MVYNIYKKREKERNSKAKNTLKYIYRKGTHDSQMSVRVNKMAKEKFNVKGIELTANEKNVYEFVANAEGAVNYKDVAEALNISAKSASSTLARLQATHGLLKKNAPVVATTYEIEGE